jgi:hypothetical protein
MEPYLHRLRGDILLKRDPADPAPAEDAYRTAMAIAKQQSARSYELLASLSLAKLYRSTRRPADARAVLAPRSRALRRRPRCLRSLRRRRCSRAWREPASAVKPISRSQWNAGCGADTGPSQGDPWRRTIRPVEASTAAICYVRSTSIRDVAQTSQMRKWRSLPNA